VKKESRLITLKPRNN